MGFHPLNLAARSILEICALLAMSIWGWRFSANWLHILSFGIPVLAGIVWGTFAVPGDPSRSGSAPIPTPGILRLLIEMLIFTLAIWMLYDLEYTVFCWIMTAVVGIHYAVSYDRIKWLIEH